MKASRALNALWYGSGRSRWHPFSIARQVIGAGLSPLSLVFGSSVALRRKRFAGDGAGERLPVPVVVVGNLTVGGSGKTPLVIALVEALRREGYTPGVVSRGYGGQAAQKGATAAAVDNALDDAADRFGDEPVLIRRRTEAPVYVGRDRTDAARGLLAAHPDVDVLLSDDGLQHYALVRNFEIAVFDARGAGNRRMLPAGPLREPMSRIAEVDAVVLNGRDATMPILPAGIVASHPPYRMELTPGQPYRVNDPTATRSLDSFRGRRITAAAGIGHPQRFFALLRGVGLSFHRMPLDDHHRYQANPFAGRNSEAILITEKDAVKCVRFEEPRMWAVPVEAHIDPDLVTAILGRIGGSKRVASSTQ